MAILVPRVLSRAGALGTGSRERRARKGKGVQGAWMWVRERVRGRAVPGKGHTGGQGEGVKFAPRADDDRAEHLSNRLPDGLSHVLEKAPSPDRRPPLLRP